MKLTVKETENLQEAVINWLSEAGEYDHSNKAAVLQRLYNYTKNEARIKNYDRFIEMYKSKESLNVLEEQELKDTLAEREKLLDCSNQECSFSSSQISSFFSQEAYTEASFRKINRELEKLINTETEYDDNLINDALAVIGDCYGISDHDLRPILAFFSQIKKRLNCFKTAGDIRNIDSFHDFGIMPAFYGPQGCGKSEFASIIAKVVSGAICEHSIDDILGNYGTLDVFYKPLIVMNEFGRQNKNNLDLLKSYINGEIVGVNRKYREEVISRCFASFILTSNFDPEMLKGTELGSRRICVIHFENNKPKSTIQEIENAVKTIWDNCDENTFEMFWKMSKEDLSRQNLEEQTTSEINEFIGSLNSDDREYLGTLHTRKQIVEYLKKNHQTPMTYVTYVIENKDVFECHISGRMKRYKINETFLAGFLVE